MSYRILVIGADDAEYFEGDAAEAITPGQIVMENSIGQIIKNTLADNSEASVRVAVENDMFGGGIDDAYAVGSRVVYSYCEPGTEFMGLVAAAAPAIAYNDPVTLDATGGIKKAASASTAVGRAHTAVDNSLGATPVRIRVIVK